MSGVSNVVLVCLVGVISGHVDNFMTSPDADTKTGFFPDSGYLRTPFSQDPQLLGTWNENPDNFNNENRLLSVPETLALKPKRLQQMMSGMPEEKAIRLEHKQFSLPSQPEDTSYLVLFTGTKDSKG